MLSEQKNKMELPSGWKTVNFYSLNLAYCFFVLFVSLQIPRLETIIVKAFGEATYNTINGWVAILLLITAAGSGILGFLRMTLVKRILSSIENNDDNPNA